MQNKKFAAVILAAGKGIRMKSDLPKVLHKLGNEALINHVLKTVYEIGIRDVFVVVGHKADLVKRECKKYSKISFVLQERQLGTGHALQQVEAVLGGDFENLLVLCGDAPLIKPQTLKDTVATHLQGKAAATILTSKLPNPKGYGRIIRGLEGKVKKIVEEKDALPDELAVNEINTGTYCFSRDKLFAALARIKSENAQKEYYLTDVIEIFNKNSQPVLAQLALDFEEVGGVNSHFDLLAASAVLKKRKILSYSPAKSDQPQKGANLDLHYLGLSGVVQK